jgi:hypothetical protein
MTYIDAGHFESRAESILESARLVNLEGLKIPVTQLRLTGTHRSRSATDPDLIRERG